MDTLSLDEARKLDYPVKIERDPDEGIFTAAFLDLPGCSADGPTVADAYEDAMRAKDEWLRVTIEQGLPIPPPSKTLESSGRVLLRMPTSLHAALIDKAQLYNTSLNQYLVHLLSSALVGDTVERRLNGVQNQISGMSQGMMVMAVTINRVLGSSNSFNAPVSKYLPSGVATWPQINAPTELTY
jgi:antitoxin HicB